LYAATLGGARALGIQGFVGALETGLQADIAVVALDGTHQEPVHDPVAAVIFASSGHDVIMTMVAGEEVYSDDRVTRVDEKEISARVSLISTKIKN
jgi:cytosine/adenosine deaminase-related metal-dependent hydrolase